jgi:beta-fructofuranosidase
VTADVHTGRRDAAPDASPHPDPAFPRLHGRPDRGWVNDPNGCSFVDGRYHVFFQYNPASPLHDAICWGHMSSADLVRWRQEPVALAPRAGELDQYGCWSGCVLDDRGIPTAAYSGVADAGARSVVLLARSDREMRTWQQGRAPVAPMPNHPAISHARDPFVFEFDGHRYAVQGAGHTDRPGAACVLVYDCDDLASWSALGPLVSIDDPIAADVAPAYIWECPNLVPFGGRWVLIVSLWSSVAGRHVLGGVRYLLGDLTVGPAGPRFTATAGGSLDDGACFYAPQVLRHHGRTLLWGWAQEHGRSEADINAAGWAGTLTFCRELSLDDGALVSRPAPELDRLRRHELPVTSGHPITDPAFEIQVGPAAGTATLWLLDGRDEQLVAEIHPSKLPARILVDGSLVEIFTTSAVPCTARAYPTAASAWTIRLANPGPLTAWILGH